MIFCNLFGEGAYGNCSNKDSKETKPKEQSFIEATEIVIKEPKY
jgi:hypothetical protein